MPRCNMSVPLSTLSALQGRLDGHQASKLGCFTCGTQSFARDVCGNAEGHTSCLVSIGHYAHHLGRRAPRSGCLFPPSPEWRMCFFAGPRWGWGFRGVDRLCPLLATKQAICISQIPQDCGSFLGDLLGGVEGECWFLGGLASSNRHPLRAPISLHAFRRTSSPLRAEDDPSRCITLRCDHRHLAQGPDSEGVVA